MHHSHALKLLGTLLIVATCTASVAAPAGNADVLARSIARYPTLDSYADTATVVRETPGMVETWKFETRYRRASLDFFFDFRGVESLMGTKKNRLDMSYHQVVLWMNDGVLQQYDKHKRLHQTTARDGNQSAVLRGQAIRTAGTATLIPSLIFAKSNLGGTILQIRESTDAGFETVNGHRCHKVIGMAAQYYPSGQMTSVRQVTVWIDAESLLIRKVFEDTPKSTPTNSFSRFTTTIEPLANPKLDDGKFQFTVPSFQK